MKERKIFDINYFPSHSTNKLYQKLVYQLGLNCSFVNKSNRNCYLYMGLSKAAVCLGKHGQIKWTTDMIQKTGLLRYSNSAPLSRWYVLDIQVF